MIVHVAVRRSFDPLDLDVEVFDDIKDAEGWCDDATELGAEDSDLFIFSCEVRPLQSSSDSMN
jgi:hypothetical protein